MPESMKPEIHLHLDLFVGTEGEDARHVIDAEGETVARCPTPELAKIVVEAINEHFGDYTKGVNENWKNIMKIPNFKEQL